jgi:hypothetical protein
LTPDEIKDKLDVNSVLNEPDFYMRAEMVLDAADKFNCRQFASPSDIVNNNKNLNRNASLIYNGIRVNFINKR